MNVKNIWLCCLVLLAAACSTEIDVLSEGEPIPTVYGVFDQGDDVHSIRLSKSFHGESDVNELLTRPSLLYYTHPAIQLQKLPHGPNFAFQLNSTLGRNEGTFPTQPNPVYQLKQQLSQGDYEITIIPEPGGDTIRSTTHIFSGMEVAYPSKATTRIYFYDDPVSLIWFPSDHATSYEVAFTLVYEEFHNDDGLLLDSVTYSRSVRIDELEWEKDRFKYQAFSAPVYGYFGRIIQEDIRIRYRKPVGLRLSITAADKDISQYLTYARDDSNIQKVYTGNLSGAIGLIGSKQTITFPDLRLSNKAMDSLKAGSHTRKLSFISNSDW